MLVYKSESNYKRENNAPLLMINNDDDDDDDDDDDEEKYFAVKSKLELYSSKWLRSKKQSITNRDNCFQDALNDALDYQSMKKTLKKYKNLSHILISITGKA